MVWQGPRLGFVTETGIFVAMALSTIFLLALVPCSLLFVFRFSFVSFLIFFLASRHVYLLRVPSSVQQPCATLSKYVVYSSCSFCLLCHLYPTPSRISFCFFIRLVFFFSQLLFLGWRFFCCALVPGKLALDLPISILQRLVFLCLTVTTDFVSLQDEESGRTLGVLLMSLGRKNGVM